MMSLRKKNRRGTLSLRTKLTIIILLSTIIAVTLLSSWFIYLRYDSFRATTSAEFNTITRIISDRATAALTFEDRQSLKENIDSLALHKDIELGCIYSRADELLAEFSRTPDQTHCPTKSKGHATGFVESAYLVAEPVFLNDEYLGRILVRASTQQLRSEILTAVLSSLILATFAILASLLFARHVQRTISDPLLELESIAHKITAHQDYSLRASTSGDNEIGELVDAFNTMLATIARQNRIIGEHTETLERTVEERTRELAATIKELEAFSYSVSHDLKAPLRSIRGFSEILIEDFSAEMHPQARNFLHRIQHNSDKMMALISSLLELSRASRKEIDKQTFKLNPLIRHLVHDLKQQHAERKLLIWIQDDMLITGDEKLLEVVYANLIGNAFKYTQHKDETRIEIGVTQHEGLPCYFVRDNGVGFDNKDAEQIFLPFSRLHSAEQFEGSGIGLATVARIISRHQGAIWADSRPSQGTTIYFKLFSQTPTLTSSSSQSA